MSNTNQSDLLAAIKRRPVGRGAWKMTLNEIMESERMSLQMLRAIGNRHPNDVETQRYIAQAALEAAERLSKLGELLHYREPSEATDGA